MTNIQAINLLKGLEQSLDDYCELNDEGKTAFRMAITALEVFGNSEQLPSVQPEQDVLAWLLAYHTKSFELHGRYFPHEVISWLVNDFSKEFIAERREEGDK